MADALTTAMRGDALRPAWFMYLATSPDPVRLWSGVANFKVGPGAGPDTAGGVYYGLGVLVAMPDLPIPLNGDFVSLELTLSGVTPATQALLKEDAPAVRQARLSIGTIELDAAGNPIGDITWPLTLWVNTPRGKRTGTSKPPTNTIGLVCSTGSPKRNITQGGYWTGVQQRQIDPDDSSCDRVSGYANGTGAIWPT